LLLAVWPEGAFLTMTMPCHWIYWMEVSSGC
jgi:hypothetical protein